MKYLNLDEFVNEGINNPEFIGGPDASYPTLIHEGAPDDKMKKVLKEFEAGILKDSNGEKVTDKDQAMAIGFASGGKFIGENLSHVDKFNKPSTIKSPAVLFKFDAHTPYSKIAKLHDAIPSSYGSAVAYNDDGFRGPYFWLSEKDFNKFSKDVGKLSKYIHVHNTIKEGQRIARDGKFVRTSINESRYYSEGPTAIAADILNTSKSDKMYQISSETHDWTRVDAFLDLLRSKGREFFSNVFDESNWTGIDYRGNKYAVEDDGDSLYIYSHSHFRGFHKLTV